jgi:hypothetical protein
MKKIIIYTLLDMLSLQFVISYLEEYYTPAGILCILIVGTGIKNGVKAIYKSFFSVGVTK